MPWSPPSELRRRSSLFAWSTLAARITIAFSCDRGLAPSCSWRAEADATRTEAEAARTEACAEADATRTEAEAARTTACAEADATRTRAEVHYRYCGCLVRM